MAFVLSRGIFSLSVFLLLVTVQASYAVSSKADDATSRKIFEQWIARHGASYRDQTEKNERFEIFKQNLRYIEDFNSVGNRTYRLGLNEFSDRTTDEFRSRYTGKFIRSGALNPGESKTSYWNMSDDDVPESVNWVERGALTSVQSQGACGSCWAFAATAAMEAVIKIKTGVLTKLSEQQIIDCDSNSGGCRGGWSQAAYQYVQKNGGLSSESVYPYTHKQGRCNTSAPKDSRISSWENLPQNDEAGLLKVVARQPISTSVALSDPFGSYKSGIYDGEGCTANYTSHAVAIVGYGTSEDGTKYWIIRNSWGPSWGEGGYMRIAREVPGRREGACLLATDPAVPYY